MNKEEAKDFLTHYICCCQYGTSPTDCGDDKCEFGMAVRTLCGENRPIGEWIGDTDYESYQGNYEAYKCSKCGYGVHWRDIPNTCPNCRAKMKGGGEE